MRLLRSPPSAQVVLLKKKINNSWSSCSPHQEPGAEPGQECSRVCSDSLMAHSVFPFPFKNPSGVTLVIIKCTIPGGREQVLIWIKRISPPPLFYPFLFLPISKKKKKICLGGREKNNNNKKRIISKCQGWKGGKKKKHIFFQGGEKMPLEVFYAKRCRGARYIKENIIHPG